jgi:osmotically-inducible protein OsmY
MMRTPSCSNALIGCACIVLLTMRPAIAQAADGRDGHFERLDLNRDGFLSYAEVSGEKSTAREFALYDANQDGKLSPEEFHKLKSVQSARRSGTYVSDSVIKHKVKAALVKSKDLQATGLHVETLRNVVTLTAEIGDAKQSERAVRLAEHVKGVRAVENKLTVMR